MSFYVKTIDRDTMRETAFLNAFGIASKISVTMFNDKDFNWDKVILDFKADNGSAHTITEHFKDGDDNSTDYVVVRNQKTGEDKEFKSFSDAERYLVSEIKGNK